MMEHSKPDILERAAELKAEMEQSIYPAMPLRLAVVEYLQTIAFDTSRSDDLRGESLRLIEDLDEEGSGGKKLWEEALEAAAKVCQESLDDLGYQARADSEGLNLGGEITDRIRRLRIP